MSKHKIDILFGEKLSGQAIKPSDRANKKFEAMLAEQHKKPVWIWWRIAAAVLLLALSTVTYLNWIDGDSSEKIADNSFPNEAVNAPKVTSSEVAVDEKAPQLENIQEEQLSADVEPSIHFESAPLAKSISTQAKDVDSAVETINPELAQLDTTAPKLNEIASIEIEPQPDTLTLSLDDKALLAENELSKTNTAKKKRLPVTIIYKSSQADPSIALLEEFSEDLDSLKDDQAKSFKSIVQTAANGSIISELRNAKNELLNLDIPAVKKSNN